MVSAIWLCPRVSITVRGDAPVNSRKVAHACRRSCSLSQEANPLPGFVPGAVDVTGLKRCANRRSEDQAGILPALTSAQLLSDLARAMVTQVLKTTSGPG